jgi:hypothetical protein
MILQRKLFGVVMLNELLIIIVIAILIWIVVIKL